MNTTGKVDVLLGLQWGDEGKGKVVDVLTPKYDVVARFQGGPNAGHTLEFEGEKYVLRSIPSGIFQGGKVNIIGNGVVLAPDLFMGEAKDLEKSGHPLQERLHISKKAHLIMPTHRVLDRAYEERHMQMLKALGWTDFEGFEETEKVWLEGVEYMKQFKFVDSEHEINNILRDGRSILCEGAQGTMLDIDFGSYPFVTSSNTVCAGACTGLGIGPNRIGGVVGIMKAYCTRVGAGPFPTELFDETGAKIRDLGHEYGAVTGRERRCGWVDLVQLKYSVMINGVTKLILMKSDILDNFDTIKACTAYELPDGSTTTELPYELYDVKPVYKEFKGWHTDMTKMTSEDEFPEEFNTYLKFLEDYLETPITIVSVGPDRAATIVRK